MERLAREIGVSRSVLAERFTHVVGQPPMQYLARWRMQLAARLLSDGAAKVAAVALDVGYDSESSFSRAFKENGRDIASRMASAADDRSLIPRSLGDHTSAETTRAQYHDGLRVGPLDQLRADAAIVALPGVGRTGRAAHAGGPILRVPFMSNRTG